MPVGGLPSVRAARVVTDSARARVLRRRVRWIVAVTIAYNAVESVVALVAGGLASSAALIGFGLDSLVEVLSAAAIAWQFAGGRDHRDRERRALQVVAFAFFALAVVVTVEAVRSLLGAGEAAHSPVGIGLAVVSVVVMPTLSWFERRTGRELGSASVVADSKQTLVCAALSAVLLAGLLANSVLGWAWADPVAALVIAAIAVREGLEALRGDACCGQAAVLLRAVDEPAASEACCADSTAEIGAATGIDVLPDGRFQAVAEPERRGGGGAGVVRPAP